MQHVFWAILINLPVIAAGQISYTFSDSLLTGFRGDTGSFRIVNGLLQLNAPPTDSSEYLAFSRPPNIDYTCEFLCRMDFSPSSTNYACFYLQSDQEDLNGTLHGYFLKIGGISGTADALELHRQDGESKVKIWSGIPGNVGKPKNHVRIKVTHYRDGTWEIASDTSGSNHFSIEGKTIDSTYQQGAFCGIVCTHTSTRNNKFYFDDIILDEAPVRIMEAVPISDSSLEVRLSRPPVFATDPTKTFDLAENSITAFQFTDSNHTLLLTFTIPLKSGHYTLHVHTFSDSSGNIVPSDSIPFEFYKEVLPEALQINEILADPQPPVLLPAYEFVELLNNSRDTLNLSGLTFCDAVTCTDLPSLKLAPLEYLILCSVEASILFEVYGNVAGLDPWPSLNNSGDSLFLKNHNQKIIANVNYSVNWFEDSQKKVGGWSLEQINPKATCKKGKNWTGSVATAGGTPGKENSVLNLSSDTQGPVITQASISENEITAIFDEKPNPDLLKLELDGTPLSIGHFHSDSLISPTPFLPTLNSFYILTAKNLHDCIGNNIQEQTMEILYPGVADSLDLLINEILFNPVPYGVDFVEIYNNSEKYIDLKNWRLGSLSGKNQIIQAPATDSNLILKPHSYFAFTADTLTLKSNFPKTENLVQLKNLPAYPDKEGAVFLYRDSSLMDFFHYSEAYQFPLLSSKQGVSLERISFSSPTNTGSNWHSAASTEGYATPGYKNSQSGKSEKTESFTITPPVFTPDDDGYKDFATISYHFPAAGFTGSIKAFDSRGRLIKTIADDRLLGKNGFFQWDGTNEQRTKVNSGIYIIIFEYFNLEGTVGALKKSVAIGTKF